MNTGVEILLVEDNPHDVELARHAFRHHNLANGIHVVRDGEEALDFMFRRGRYEDRMQGVEPDVILLDLKLPKVDGMEVLKELKTHPITRHIPIVVLTSSNDESDIVRSYNLGVNSYIVKPVDFDQFTEAVRIIGFYWLLINRSTGVAGARENVSTA